MCVDLCLCCVINERYSRRCAKLIGGCALFSLVNNVFGNAVPTF